MEMPIDVKLVADEWWFASPTVGNRVYLQMLHFRCANIQSKFNEMHRGFVCRSSNAIFFLFFYIVNDFPILVDGFATFDCLLSSNFPQLSTMEATFVTGFLTRCEKSVDVDADKKTWEFEIARVPSFHSLYPEIGHFIDDFLHGIRTWFGNFLIREQTSAGYCTDFLLRIGDELEATVFR